MRLSLVIMNHDYYLIHSIPRITLLRNVKNQEDILLIELSNYSLVLSPLKNLIRSDKSIF